MNFLFKVKSDYGSFHPYGFFITLGIFLTILASVWQLRRKKINISWVEFELGAVIVVSAALLGGSLIGKITLGQYRWYQKFYFWERGMAIYGAILFGAVAFILFFGFIGQKRHISLWAFTDAIVPNILLGQAMGRWGNFFNHELLGGQVIDRSALNWLPRLIADNSYLYDDPGHFRQPLFFYEFLLDLFAWGLLILCLARVSEWRGPRQRVSQLLSDRERRQHRSFMQELFFWKNKNMMTPTLITSYQLWVRDFYCTQPSVIKQQEVALSQKNSQTYNPHDFFIVRVGVVTGCYFLCWTFIRAGLTTMRNPQDFYTIAQAVKDQLPSNGVGTSQQIWVEISWMLLIGLLGLAWAILAQTKWFVSKRKQHFFYEKPSHNMCRLENWSFTQYCQRFMVCGVDNRSDKIPNLLIRFINYHLGTVAISKNNLSKYFDIQKIATNTRYEQQLTLYFKVKIVPTLLAQKKWSLSDQPADWICDQRINLRNMKSILCLFITYRRQHPKTIMVDYEPWQFAIHQQLIRYFTYLDLNYEYFNLPLVSECFDQQIRLLPHSFVLDPLFYLKYKIIVQ